MVALAFLVFFATVGRGGALGLKLRVLDDPALDQPALDHDMTLLESGGTGGCLEDMCSDDIPSSFPRSNTATVMHIDSDGDDEKAVTDLNLPIEYAGCTSTEDSSSRMVLTAIVQAYHGSTALEEVLMSSNKIATLCSCNSWQCEAGKVEGLKDDDAWSWNYNDYLQALGQCWDLDKPVLFEKFMVPHECNTLSAEVFSQVGENCQVQALVEFDKQLGQAKIPDNWPGVSALNHAYLILWRPICMTKLSSHAQADIQKGDDDRITLMKNEIHLLTEAAETHRLLVGKRPVLVMSLASLIWEAARNKKRIEAWMPCVGEVSTSYVPELNKDIFATNQFKADGSVEDYGNSIDPSSFYNVESRDCIDYDLLKGLPDQLTTQAMDASRYLTALS